LPALLPIDHIYAGRAWRTVRLVRGPRVGSEHYPLVIDLALRP
jgi:endonuclease/exonuclease/phosphatase (EEP) superfamily protein YafD